jgi:hypothetical protein
MAIRETLSAMTGRLRYPVRDRSGNNRNRKFWSYQSAPGRYIARLSVRDSQSVPGVVQRELSIIVFATRTLLSDSADSDNDGIQDSAEGDADTDGDGTEDYRDNDNDVNVMLLTEGAVVWLHRQIPACA